MRRIFSIFNLGLVIRSDLNHLHHTQIAHQCLVHKLGFYLDLRDRAQQNLEKSSFEVLSQSNLLLESKSEMGKIYSLSSLISISEVVHFLSSGLMMESLLVIPFYLRSYLIGQVY